jgi:hypothetical protein
VGPTVEADRERTREEFDRHLDDVAIDATSCFKDKFEAVWRCGAPIGGFAHVTCTCVCSHPGLFCSDPTGRGGLLARKIGEETVARASTTRLFEDWAALACPIDAYQLLQEFVVVFARDWLKGTGDSKHAGNRPKRGCEAAESSAAAEKRAKPEIVCISSDSDSDSE